MKHHRKKPKPKIEAVGVAPGGRPTDKAAHRGDDGKLVQVERVVDTIDGLFKRNQITIRQYDAAVMYRGAWEAVWSEMRCALDQSVLGGGSGHSSPSEAQLAGRGKLKEARKVLGLVDAWLVELVAGHGHSMAEAAVKLFREASRSRVEYTGRRLRDALTVLSDQWFPSAPGRGQVRAVRYVYVDDDGETVD